MYNINRTKLKLETYGCSKKWILTDRDEGKCFLCGKKDAVGMYCPEGDKFWCIGCENKARVNNIMFPCKCLALNEYHENFRVICRKDEKKEGT